LKKFEFSKKYRIIGKKRQNIGLYRTNFKNIGNIGLLRGQFKRKNTENVENLQCSRRK